jgi:hypothetical protein
MSSESALIEYFRTPHREDIGIIPSGKIKGGNEEVLVVKMKDKIIKKSDKIYHPSFKKL